MWGGCRQAMGVSSASAPSQWCFPFITAVMELKAEDRSKFLDALVTLLS